MADAWCQRSMPPCRWTAKSAHNTTAMPRKDYADVIRVMLATAPHDQAVAEQERAATAIYRAGLVRIARRLVQLGQLRPGVHTADAVDLLWFYFGYSSYFTLHDDNGWSYERAERWLADQAIAALLP
jgi:hypothetical protein